MALDQGYKSPKKRCSMGKIFSFTNDSDDAFLQVENPIQIGWIRRAPDAMLQQLRYGKTNVQDKNNKIWKKERNELYL